MNYLFAPETTRKKSLNIIAGAAILCAAYAAFFITSPGGFLSDDFNILNSVAAIDSGNFFRRIIIPNVSWGFYRPIGTLYWFVLYKIFFLNSFGYWIASILNHGLNGILLFLIMRRLGLGYMPALASGLIFVAFPLHGEAVAWMACGYERLSLLFIFSGLYFHLLFREGKGNILQMLSLVFFVLALLSKEMAITFPALIFLLDLTWEGMGLRGIKGSALRALPSAFIATAYVAARLAVFHGVGGYSSAGGGSIHSSMDIGVISYNLSNIPSLLIFPINTVILKNPSFLIILLTAIFALLVIIRTFYGGSNARFFLLGFFWMSIAYLPAMTLYLSFPNLMSSRFSYIPSVGFAVIAGSLFGGPPREVRWTTALRGSVLVVLLGCYLYLCTSNYKSWPAAYNIARFIPDEVRKLAPTPPSASKMYFIGKYDNIAGAYIYRNGLRDAINIAYGRKGDISVNFIGPDGRVLEDPSLTFDILRKSSGKDNIHIFAFDNVRKKMLPVYLPEY